jgi:hypothetical protein
MSHTKIPQVFLKGQIPLLSLAKELKLDIDSINESIADYLVKSLMDNNEYGGTINSRSKLIPFDTISRIKLTKGNITVEFMLNNKHLSKIKRTGVFWHTHPFGNEPLSRADIEHFMEYPNVEKLFITASSLDNRSDWYQVNYLFRYEEELCTFSYFLKYRRVLI